MNKTLEYQWNMRNGRDYFGIRTWIFYEFIIFVKYGNPLAFGMKVKQWHPIPC